MKLREKETSLTEAKHYVSYVTEKAWREECAANQIKCQTHRINEIIAQRNRFIPEGYNTNSIPKDLFLTRIRDRYGPAKNFENPEENKEPGMRKAKKRKLVVEVETRRIKNKKVKYRREFPTVTFSNAKSPYWAKDLTPKSYVVCT